MIITLAVTHLRLKYWRAATTIQLKYYQFGDSLVFNIVNDKSGYSKKHC